MNGSRRGVVMVRLDVGFRGRRNISLEGLAIGSEEKNEKMREGNKINQVKCRLEGGRLF